MKVQILTYSHARILFKNKKKWTVNLWNNIDGLQHNSAVKEAKKKKTRVQTG